MKKYRLLIIAIVFGILTSSCNLIANQKAKDLFEEGLKYHELGKIDEAIEYYNKALELNPEFDEAYFHRGVAYTNKREYQTAKRDFEKVIELDSNRQRKEEARKLLSVLENLEDAQSYCNRGLVYQNKGEHNLAMKDFNKAIELNPEFIDAYYSRGMNYCFTNEYDLAILDFNKTIELSPENTNAYFMRGFAYLNKTEYDLAIKDYSKVIELNPEFTDAYYSRGLAYNKKGEYDLAIKDNSKAIELRPGFSDAFYNRGVVYWKKGEYKAAKKDLEKALELSPKGIRGKEARKLLKILESEGF